jgi:hypothetical protein
MKYRNLLIAFVLALLLFAQALPLSAAETDNKTVLLKVYVSSVGG